MENMPIIQINRHNNMTHKFFGQYFSYNLYNYNITNEKINKRIDSNIVELNLESEETPILDFTGYNIKGKYRHKAFTEINTAKFTIKYKLKTEEDEEKIVNYYVEIVSNNDLSKSYNYLEEKPSNVINIKALDELSYDIFEIFTKEIHKYVRTNINNMSSNDEDVKIYCNDDSYWDELQAKRARPMDTVYLPKEDKSLIIKDLEWFISEDTKQRYQKLGRTHKRVYLFEGIPGSGKTTFISALAAMYGYDIAIITFTHKVTDDKFIRLIRTLPEKTLLVLEDIDCLFEDRKKNDGHKNVVTFSGILNALDGIATPDNFICFITTNYKSNLDSALLRPGRIDKILKFKTVVKSQIKEIYKAYMEMDYSDDKFKDFYRAYQELNIKPSVSLIQEYLFKYLDNPDGALEHIDDMKDIYDNSNKAKAELYM